MKNFDYTIDKNEKVWISIKKVSEEINLLPETIKNHINKNFPYLSINEYEQIDSQTLIVITEHFANRCIKSAVTFLTKLAISGSEQYIKDKISEQFLKENPNVLILNNKNNIKNKNEDENFSSVEQEIKELKLDVKILKTEFNNLLTIIKYIKRKKNESDDTIK